MSKPYFYLCHVKDAKTGIKDVDVEAFDKEDARNKLEAQGLEVLAVLIPKMSTNLLGKQSNPRNLFATAKHFLEGYQIINKNYHKHSVLYKVKLFLLGHSLELGLKAFLLSICKEYTVPFLMKYQNMSHDLEKGIMLCEQVGCPIFNDDEREIILLLNKYYKSSKFEYEKMDFKGLPWSNVENVCINFLEKITDRIKSN